MNPFPTPDNPFGSVADPTPVPTGEFIIGTLTTPVGAVPITRTSLGLRDWIGTLRVRLGWNRNRYRVTPGLYATGKPDADAPVLVTANYKLSFDALRRELGVLDAWILVLDTQGVNVWCAAGKGTFGTEELIARLYDSALHRIVNHRRIILPQLGAPGVTAIDVYRRTGFKVVFGPVRASDLPRFIASDLEATGKMRQVQFSLADRLVLVPTELVHHLKPLLLVLGVLHLLNLLGWTQTGSHEVILLLGSLLAGDLLTPALLPWLPGRAFAIKGWLAGLIITGALILLAGGPLSWATLSHLLIMPAISAYLGLNFTGSTPLTSPSGVEKEMRVALPLIVLSLTVGLLIWAIVTFSF